MDKKKKDFGTLFLVMSAVCWSLGGLLVKSVAWSAISLVTVRGLISFVIYLFLVKIRGIRLNTVKLISGFCYFMEGIFLILGNKYTTAGCATALQNAAPLFILLLNAVILKIKPGKSDLITCLLLLIGIALCLMGGFREGRLTGNLFAIISAVFYAGVFFTNRLEGANALESLLLGNLMYVILIPFVVSDRAVPGSTVKDLLCVLAFCLLTGTVAWFCFSKGIETTPALGASFIVMLEPVLSPVWTLIFLGEKMGIWSVMGCAIVILTIIVYNINQQRKRAT